MIIICYFSALEGRCLVPSLNCYPTANGNQQRKTQLDLPGHLLKTMEYWGELRKARNSAHAALYFCLLFIGAKPLRISSAEGIFGRSSNAGGNEGRSGRSSIVGGVRGSDRSSNAGGVSGRSRLGSDRSSNTGGECWWRMRMLVGSDMLSNAGGFRGRRSRLGSTVAGMGLGSNVTGMGISLARGRMMASGADEGTQCFGSA